MTSAQLLAAAARSPRPYHHAEAMRIQCPSLPAVWLRIGGQDGLSIALKRKPNFFHRFMVELVFGFEYLDASPFGDANVPVHPS